MRLGELNNIGIEFIEMKPLPSLKLDEYNNTGIQSEATQLGARCQYYKFKNIA